MMMTKACAFLFLAGCMVGADKDDNNDLSAGDTLDSDSEEGGAELGQIEANVCPTGPTTPGIDVSYYQGTVNWAAVRAAGMRFAIVRVSSGDTVADTKFAENWAGAKQAGLVRGAYQYFKPNQNVLSQANKMIAAIGTYQRGDLPPVIDVEDSGGLAPAQVAAAVRTWVDRVKGALGVDPMIYTGAYYWRDQIGSPTGYANHPLWVANYRVTCPDIPAPWQKWAIWQYSDEGRVNGITGPVDMNKFNGTPEQLIAFANGAGMSPPGGACSSATLNRDVPSGACVQAASDAQWYRCDAGAWILHPEATNCTAMYGWCNSGTLGRAVPPRACVRSSTDNNWYQCDGQIWTGPVDPIAQTGPAGVCSVTYQL